MHTQFDTPLEALDALHDQTLLRHALTTNDVTLIPRGAGSPIESREDIEVTPFIYSAPMDTVTGYELTQQMVRMNEFPVISRFLSLEERTETIKAFGSLENVFIAIGLDDIDTVIDKHFNLPICNVAIDIAHGDMYKAHQAAEALRSSGKIRHIMSGSICTPEAAERAARAGCSHLRIGIGPGAACTTRLMTGIGMPNLTAVQLIYRHFGQNRALPQPYLIADGGIKHPGDAVKYLAAGADAVMLGSVLSKTKESAGWAQVRVAPKEDYSAPISFPRETPPLQLVKSFRGQASAEFQQDQGLFKSDCPEGKASEPFCWDGKTTVASVVLQYRGGVRSACSYLGTPYSKNLRYHANFIRITPAGYIEGTAHGV